VRRIVVYSAIFALIYLVLDFSYLIFIKKLPFLSALNENLPLQISMVIIFLITGFILEKSSNTDVKTEKKEESYISLQKAIISSIFSPISLDLKSQNLLQEVANTLSLEFATLLNYKKDEIINIAEISPNEHFSVSKNISLKQQGSSQLERMILDFHASSEEFSIKNFNEYSVVFSSLKPSYLTKEIGCLVLVFKKDIEIDDKIKEFIDFLSQNIEFSLSLWLKKEELSQVSSSSPVSISLPNGIEPYAKMEEVLTFETRRYKRYGAPLALLLFSVDHFENLSNIFGKEKGDLLLKEILLLVKNATRTTDIVAHWKDGIFAVVMPQNSFGDASALANKLRGLIAKRHFSNLGKVTCSFGASMLESQKDSSDLLKQRALDALNKAKSLGGDRAEIVLYSTEFESLSIR